MSLIGLETENIPQRLCVTGALKSNKQKEASELSIDQ